MPRVPTTIPDALANNGPHPPAGARWQLRLLGDLALTSPQARQQQTLLRLPSRAASALLARLAMAPQRAHAREELIELLWPGVALDVGRNRLRQVLSTLKSLLDAPSAAGTAVMPVLQADRQALRLTPDALSCDVPAFEAAMRAGRFDEARALYRGELLPGFADEWIVEERLRLAALADRLDEAGVAAPAITASVPAAHVSLPSASAPLPPAANPAARPLLPHYLTPLHGADTVGASLRAEVLAHRLVTLLGPGGHGKTRLAVEVAQALSDGSTWAGSKDHRARFDMVAFVPLVGCTQHEEMLDALMLALRQEGRAGDMLQHLAGVLAGRRTLLVLDNFEQLVDAGASVVAALIERNPGLHLLVTSRRSLGVDGELEFVLPPLPVPAHDAGDDASLNPAVALFVDRARAVRADFHLSSRNRDAVIALVRLLEGMPLAIELAASRVRSVPPASLLALLQTAQQHGQSQDGEALTLLARSGPRGGSDPRHASMLAVVQWSWQLLSPGAQALLGRLSVFAGGCTLEAAQAVCGDAGSSAAAVALALDELVMHSMLRSDADSGRYELFELIRVFAATTLPTADAAVVRSRHRRWLIHWGSALPLSTPLHELRHELANIGAALTSAAADAAPEDAADMVDAMQGPMSDLSLPQGALRALARCADALPEDARRSMLRAFLARALLRAGDPAAAAPMADQAWAELPDASLGQGLPRAWVLARLAHLRWRTQRDAGVQTWLDEAFALAEAAGAQPLMASVLATQGAVARPRDAEAAIALQRRSLSLWSLAGDIRGMDTGRTNLAIALAESTAGCAEALALLEDMLASTRASGDWVSHAHGCNARGEALARLRRWPEAAQAYRDCVQVAFALPEMLPLAYGLWNLPRALAHAGQPGVAASLMGFSEQFAPLHCGPLSRSDRRDLRRVQRLCRLQMPSAELAQAWREGAALGLSDAVRLALQGRPQ